MTDSRRCVGPYELQGVVGRGSMSVVYRARHTVLDRAVALKFLYPDFEGDPRYAERLLAGARLLARLSHPHLGRVLDAGHHDGHPYVVMDYLEGVAANRLVAERGPLGVRQAARVADALADALGRVHQAGVIHTDLKPSNILVEPGGRPVLVGFDLACPMERQDPLPMRTYRLPNFLPPELDAGHPADRRTDVWGLGATLYFLLTGLVPFDHGDPAAIRRAAARASGHLAPRGHNDRVPAALDALVARMAHAVPAERPADMDQVRSGLHEALGRSMDDETTEGTRTPGGGRADSTVILWEGPLRLGHYRLLERVGSGGFGFVYRARDETLDRDVALKLLRPELSTDPAAVERFRREARSASRIHHRYVVDIYALGSEGAHHYFAMEFIAGADLALTLAVDGRLEWRRAFDLGARLAEGLAAAHEAGVVHRDLKPHNILLDGWERPVITDFGIARVASLGPITEAGSLVGTCRYMSPEQAEDLPAGPASDLYSLGVVLYEALAGEVPHRAESPLALLRKIATEPPPPLGPLGIDLPEAARTVLGRLLAKAPSDRYPGAREAAAALWAALAGAGPEA
ncbi:MAG: serine/threonine protein kinase [Planctomycetes bacterium]|nr:serine/threonine protein kinase [Planctomycetota bacterium]